MMEDMVRYLSKHDHISSFQSKNHLDVKMDQASAAKNYLHIESFLS